MDEQRLDNTIDIMLQMQAKTDVRLDQVSLQIEETIAIMKGALTAVEKTANAIREFVHIMSTFFSAEEEPDSVPKVKRPLKH